MKLFKFIGNALKSEQPESSKRLFGGIGFICAIVFIALWEHDLINELLFVSSGLLGLETITKVFKK